MQSPDRLYAISPVDGRYREKADTLRTVASEYGLIKYRVMVECAYLHALAAHVPAVGALTPEQEKILAAVADLSEDDALLVKRIEEQGYGGIPATRHDVKAVEYFIREKIRGTALEPMGEWIHFGLTSEDVNNIAYALMLRACAESVELSLGKIITHVSAMAVAHADLPILARTHGQPASPSTFGKEMRIFSERLAREKAKLSSFEIFAKLNGATGNYNALAAAFPKTDWLAFSESFIESLNTDETVRLVPNLYTSQIEPHDSYAELFQLVARINTILVGFSEDIWRYVSDGWINQKPVKGEVGSSTMPHKVNPIRFENAEGNLGVANALFNHFAAKLPISRLQRDLSDSTVERVFGTAFAHTLIAYESLLSGLQSIEPNRAAMQEALAAHPEVLAEAIQTILRREGVTGGYEALKDLTRGKTLTLDALRAFVKGLEITPAAKQELLALAPETYLGLAERLARGD